MFPVNLVIGGVIGSVTTYVYKDEKAREWVLKTGNTIKEGALSFAAAFRKKPEEAATETAAQTDEAVDAPAEKNKYLKEGAQSFMAAFRKKSEETATEAARLEGEAVDAAAEKKTE